MILEPQPIRILALNQKSKEIGAIRFDKGSPSPTIPSSFSKEILDEISKNLTANINTYPSEYGYEPLINSIISIEKRVNMRQIKKENICLTNGALSGIFSILACLCNHKDAILLNDLSFEGFHTVVDTLRLLPVYVELDDRVQLEKSIIKHRPKFLIFSTPENPSGKIYQKDELRFIDYLAQKYDFLVISDEVNNQNIYEPFSFSPPNSYITKNRLITVNSFSKNYFLPGIRLGWIAADLKLIPLFRTLTSGIQVSIGYPTQVIANAIITQSLSEIEAFRKEVMTRKNVMEDVLQKQGLKYLNPVMAGFVFFVNVNTDSEKLSEYLLSNYKIGVVPGSYFGSKWKSWIRLGFGAVEESEIKKGIPVIGEVLSRLKL